MTNAEIKRRLDELRSEIDLIAERLPDNIRIETPVASDYLDADSPAVMVREFMGCSYVSLSHADGSEQSTSM